MAGEPHLRAVADEESPQPRSRAEPRLAVARPWIPIALALALALALGTLAWSRAQLGQRISALEDQVRTLDAAVAERDRVIEAHRGRLEEVRRTVGDLQELLERPLPRAE